MPFLPVSLAPVILTFAPLFSQRVWPQAQTLLLGAILAPGQRTVTSGLRILGLCQERHFVNYHRVLSRAHWRGREASRLLLGLLVKRFVPTGPIVLGIDDTIERRRGKRIQARASTATGPVRHGFAHPLALGRSSVAARQVRACAAFIDKDQILRLHAA